jgi:uncharacterized protein
MPYPYKCVLITGATSGIGEAFADHLAPGANLLLTGRNAKKLTELKTRFGSYGHKVETITANLAEPNDRSALLEAAKNLPIDLLINNAGLGAYGAFTQTDPHQEAEMVAVNVTAIIELSRALLPAMIARAQIAKSRAGMIVVSSTASITPIPFLATYAATKAFERHWGEALGEELRHDPIDILVLCPGATRTNFFRRARMETSLLKNIEEPEAVARKGLNALGRQNVFISNATTRMALAPALLPRRLLTSAIGYFLRKQH